MKHRLLSLNVGQNISLQYDEKKEMIANMNHVQINVKLPNFDKWHGENLLAVKECNIAVRDELENFKKSKQTSSPKQKKTKTEPSRTQSKPKIVDPKLIERKIAENKSKIESIMNKHKNTNDTAERNLLISQRHVIEDEIRGLKKHLDVVPDNKSLW
jgi:hypothetical protein